ncbi:MAG: DUF1328 domain-containing protein [Pseudolabrys sp.]
MLKWALIFLIIAVVAGIFGFTNVEAASATIAQWLSGIFVVLFLGAFNHWPDPRRQAQVVR